MEQLYISIIYIGMVVFFICMIIPAFQLMVWMRTNKRFLAIILESDKPLDFKLIKADGNFIKDGEDTWIIQEKQIKLVKFPLMPPKFLAPWARLIPASLYTRGRAEPLDWEAPALGPNSSKELGPLLDPVWLKVFLKGVSEGAGMDKKTRMMIFLSAGAGILCLLLMFVVMSKL